jgi:hypothetical protein
LNACLTEDELQEFWIQKCWLTYFIEKVDNSDEKLKVGYHIS